jgi:hypothetical protein
VSGGADGRGDGLSLVERGMERGLVSSSVCSGACAPALWSPVGACRGMEGMTRRRYETREEYNSAGWDDDLGVPAGARSSAQGSTASGSVGSCGRWHRPPGPKRHDKPLRLLATCLATLHACNAATRLLGRHRTLPFTHGITPPLEVERRANRPMVLLRDLCRMARQRHLDLKQPTCMSCVKSTVRNNQVSSISLDLLFSFDLVSTT